MTNISVNQALEAIKRNYDALVEENQRLKEAVSKQNVMTVSDLLVVTRGNQSEVSRMLGINRGTLRRVIKGNVDHIVILKDGEYRYYRRFVG